MFIVVSLSRALERQSKAEGVSVLPSLIQPGPESDDSGFICYTGSFLFTLKSSCVFVDSANVSV